MSIKKKKEYSDHNLPYESPTNELVTKYSVVLLLLLLLDFGGS